MFGFLGEVVAFLKLLVGLASYLAAGAGAALVGQIVGRWLSPILGIALGSALVGGVAVFYWSTDDSALKAENAALRAKNTELVLTTAELRKTISEEIRVSESNAEVMKQLREKLSNMPDNAECVINQDIVDDLNKIR